MKRPAMCALWLIALSVAWVIGSRLLLRHEQLRVGRPFISTQNLAPLLTPAVQHRLLPIQEVLRPRAQANSAHLQPNFAERISVFPELSFRSNAIELLGYRRQLQQREQYTIDLADERMAYFGLLHTHTLNSDGTGSTVEAFAYGRDIGRLDFMAVTDHPEYWVLSQAQHWQDLQAAAKAATRSDFIALPGFEYSHTLYGHYIVIGTQSFRPSYLDYQLHDFYNWLAAPQQKDALVFFAHPGLHHFRRATEFDHFVFDKRLLQRLIGIEAIHWNMHTPLNTGYDGVFPYVDEALQKGWQLGFAGSQDNHHGGWGTTSSTRLAVLLPKLSEQNLKAGLQARHFYATTNNNLQLSSQIQRVDGSWAAMGDSLNMEELGDTPTHTFCLRYFDPENDALAFRFELIVDGYVAALWTSEWDRLENGDASKEPAFSPKLHLPFRQSWRSTQGEFRVEIPATLFASPGRHYVYARFWQGRRGQELSVTSPIFLQRNTL